jgi:hypothetical protein
MIRAALFYLDAALRGSAKIFCRLQLIIFRDIQKKRTHSSEFVQLRRFDSRAIRIPGSDKLAIPAPCAILSTAVTSASASLSPVN